MSSLADITDYKLQGSIMHSGNRERTAQEDT